MLNFTFYSPTKFYFGKDAELRTAEAVKALGVKKLLLHSGGGSAERSGLLGRIRSVLQSAGLAFVELKGVVPNPRLELVYEGIELARREKCELILSVGGGSVADSAKAIAAGVPYAGDVWDFYEGKAVPERVLPVATVMTLAATGTEGSNSSVISKTDENGIVYKRGLNHDALRPAFSLLNPELTFTVPAYHKAAGITDILSHILERYISNTEDVDLTDRLSEALMQTVIQAAPQALQKADDYAAHATIMWAGTLAHNNLLGVGRQQDWSSHQIEHELSAAYDCSHGAGLAVVQPAFMAYTLKTNVRRYAQFAVRVMGVPENPYHQEATAAEGIRRFRDFLRSLGMPDNLRAFGMKEEEIPLIAARVKRTNGERLGFFQPLDQADIEAILLSCY